MRCQLMQPITCHKVWLYVQNEQEHAAELEKKKYAAALVMPWRVKEGSTNKQGEIVHSTRGITICNWI